MTSPLMKMSAVAETGFVEKTRKPERAASARKRAPKPPVATDPGAPLVRLAFAGLVALVAASAGAAFLLLRGDDSPQIGAPAAVSAETLKSFASSHDGPVYWIGPIAARKLELTSTADGTFVRYLPLSASIGDSARAITVGTYPMRHAYATAVGRAKTTQMTSRETVGGGIAVWSKTRPTSVYLAFPGVPHLVEVYAPDADQARTLALSGRIRPVS